MKSKSIFFAGLIMFILIGCSGSETYRGNWKATDANGKKFNINFYEKSFSVKDSIGDSIQYHYTQNSVSIENAIATYGIKLKDDGRNYEINFPVANNKNVGLIKDQNGKPLYIISRTDYISYDDLYKLK